MDETFKFVDPIERRFPNGKPVMAIGLQRKRSENRIRRVFDTFNFSFLLEGSGDYRLRGRSLRLQAPCVFVQWPGEPVDYGPDRGWTELFVIYRKDRLPALQASKLADSSRPLWQTRQPDAVRRYADHLLHRLRHWNAAYADEIDRLCELMAVASLTPSAPVEANADDQAGRLDKARQWLESHCHQDVSIDCLAERFGFSPVAFRRSWNRLHDCPPMKHLTRLRVERACGLLVETELPVGDIARRVGYEDALYFSRRFRQSIGLAPTEYRKLRQPAIQKTRPS